MLRLMEVQGHTASLAGTALSTRLNLIPTLCCCFLRQKSAHYLFSNQAYLKIIHLSVSE